MEYHFILAIASLFCVVLSFILMQVSKRKFTEGYFRKYMDLVVLSGSFMGAYLLISVTLRLGIIALNPYQEYIKILSYTLITIASLILTKSSKVLGKMGKKYGFNNHKFFKQFQ